MACALCGKESAQFEILCRSYFGNYDLDTRPPPLARYTLDHWIMSCPHCGYCTPDISKRHPDAPSVVQSKEYKELWGSEVAKLVLVTVGKEPNFKEPSAAVKFLCFAMIQEAGGETAGAGWAYLHAAWACDDENKKEKASECRKSAIVQFEKCLKEKKKFFEQRGGEYAMLAELYRRTGQFDAAVTISEREMENAEPIIVDVLRCEARLARASDDGCHSA